MASDSGSCGVNIKFSDDEVEAIGRLIDLCNLSGHKELLNNSIAVFEWAVEQSIRGRKIVSEDSFSKERFVLFMPVLKDAFDKTMESKLLS